MGRKGNRDRTEKNTDNKSKGAEAKNRIALVIEPMGGSTGGGQIYAAVVAHGLSERQGWQVYMPELGGPNAINTLPEDSEVIVDSPPTQEIDLLIYAEPLGSGYMSQYLESYSSKRSILFAYYFNKDIQTDIPRRFSGVLCLSKDHAQLCRDYWDVKPKVIPPGIIPIPYRPELKENLAITVGRLDRYKAHSLAMRFAKSFLPDWSFASVGFLGTDQEEFGALQGLEVELHVNVTDEERDAVLQRASIGLFLRGLNPFQSYARDMEGWGMSLVESMSAGCVPIAFNGGGHKDIITPESGILIEKDHEVIEALTLLSENKKLRDQLAEGAAKRARALTRDRFLPKTLDYLTNQVE